MGVVRRNGYDLHEVGLAKFLSTWEAAIVRGLDPEASCTVDTFVHVQVGGKWCVLPAPPILDAELVNYERETFVYFMQRETGPIKIGYSVDPVKRRESLQRAVPEAIHLLKTIFAGNSEKEAGRLEESLHLRFKHLRIRQTEWFTPGEDLIAFIQSLE